MNLLIIGAGGHGQCCHEIAEKMECFDKISFLDDHERFEISDIVVGKISHLEKFKDEYEYVFIAIGNNKLRKELYIRAKEAGYQIPILIDPKASVSKYCHIGEGSVVFPNAVVETHSYLGKCCVIGSNATVHFNSRINDYALISSHVVVRPEAYVGAMSTIGSNSIVFEGTIVKEYSEISEGSIVNISKS